MKVDLIANNEAANFIDTLGKELELAKINKQTAINSEYVIGAFDEQGVIGICGTRLRYKKIPELYIVVRQSHQGKGIGRELILRNILEAKKRHSFLTLSTLYGAEWQGALNLYKKCGFKVINWGEHIWMGISFTFMGKLLLNWLPYYLPVLKRVRNLVSL